MDQDNMTNRKKLSIAFVLPEFVTENKAGGIATYYDNLSRLLAEAGNRVVIFVLSDRTEKILYYSNIIVERIHIDISCVDVKVPGSYIRFWSKQINNIVRDRLNDGEKIDIIQYANYMGLGFDRLEDIPTIVRISSFQPYWRAASQWTYKIDDYKCETAADFLEMISVIKADSVYGPSKLLANVFERESGKKVRVIESPFYPKQKIDNSCKELIPLGKKYLLTFSTLNLLKGIRVIGESIKAVLENNTDVYWVFAGLQMPLVNDYDEKVSPSQYILEKVEGYSDRVIFLGKVEHDKLMYIVKNAEACIMPSRVDNLPNTCVEAMALGKIVVGTIGASFDQLITDEESGFLVDIDNKDDLIRTINKVLRLNQKQKKIIAKNAKKRINMMKPELIVEEILKLYEETINSFNEKLEYRDNLSYKKMRVKYNDLMKAYTQNYENYSI